MYKTIISNSPQEGDNNAMIYNIKNNIYFSGPLTDESIFAITSNLITMQYNDNTEINLLDKYHSVITMTDYNKFSNM